VAESAQVRARARNAVYIVFTGAGFAFASWASRIPQVRGELRVTPGVLGLILLCAAIGSAVAIPLSGLIIARLGESRAVVAMSLVAAAGLATVATGWDVAMNVQGAAVEQAIGRAIMPRFHAGWSIGTVAGAGAGTAMVAVGVPVTAHLLAVALAVAVVVPAASRRFLPHSRAQAFPGRPAVRPSPLLAWTETRTLLIGLFVLCMTIIEGAGNDWLSLGVIDGYHTAAVVGTVTFAIFLAAMTTGRWFGPGFIDRYGRVRVLRVSAVTALAGLLLVAFGGLLPAVLAGAALMGLGTALGFPVGLSAAADDPRHAAGRVSVASSIGYAAFLAGPPVIGFLADHVGVLNALSAASVLLAAAFFCCRATAPIGQPPGTTRNG